MNSYWESRNVERSERPLSGRRKPRPGEELTWAVDGPDKKFAGFIKAKDLKEARLKAKEYGDCRVCSKVGFRG